MTERDSGDLIADRDRPARKDVGSESAPVNARSQETRTRESFKVSAWFREASADALDLADPESLAHERVERDPVRHDVATCLFPPKTDFVEHVCFDKGELVSVSGSVEGSQTIGVAVSCKSATRERLRRLDARERSLGRRRDEDCSYATATCCRPVWGVRREMEVEWREHVSSGDFRPVAVGATRVEPYARGRSEQQDGASSLGLANKREPLSGPVKRRRFGDRHEAEIPFGEPLPVEPDRLDLPIPLRNLIAQHLCQTSAEILGERSPIGEFGISHNQNLAVGNAPHASRTMAELQSRFAAALSVRPGELRFRPGRSVEQRFLQPICVTTAG